MAHRKNDFDDDLDDPLFRALQSMEPCGNCGAEGANIPCMSGCGAVFYCSRECNINNASAHRLRCRNLRTVNIDSDEDSGSDSDDYEEYTGSEDDSESESEEEEVKPKKVSKEKSKAKGKSGKKQRRVTSQVSIGSDRQGGGVVIEADLERRIEDRILKKIKQVEEARLNAAIEKKMRELQLTWGGKELNDIIREVRKELPEMNYDQLPVHGHANADQPPSNNSNTQEPKITPEALQAVRSQSVAIDETWNNQCVEFAALRVVVWKHTHLPHLKFDADKESGCWNVVTELDPDDSFKHVSIGDALLSVNGRTIDASSVTNQNDLDDILNGFASPLLFKFTASDPNNGTVHDYTVTWCNGPLGVTLKDESTHQKIPIVNRLTKKAGSVAVKQDIAIGDILVAINNIDTIQLGCSLSMSILKKVQLPAKLRFRGTGGPVGDAARVGTTSDDSLFDTERRRASMSRPASYTVQWNDGPLGLTIIPGIEESDLPVIKKITGTGLSPGIEKAQVGDLLEVMNDIRTSGMHFEDVVHYLKNSPKPIHLRFKACIDMGPDEPYSPSRIAKSKSEKVLSSPGNSTPIQNQTTLPSRRSRPSDSADTYKVVWGAGPLGLTIDAIPGASFGAYIKRVMDKGVAVNLSDECVGDELTHINDWDVTRVNFKEVVTQLKNVPRPVTLYFRRRVSSVASTSSTSTASVDYSSPVVPYSSPNNSYQAGLSSSQPPPQPTTRKDHNGTQYYNLVWQEGTTLGLSLRPAEPGLNYPYINRVIGGGSAAHLSQSAVNDLLISVDGRSVHVRDKTFDEVMTMLKQIRKPVTLRFQSRGSTTTNLSSSMNSIQNSVRQGERLPPPPPPVQSSGNIPPPQYGWRQNSHPSTSPPPPLHNQSYSSSAPDNPSGMQNNSLSRSFLSNESQNGFNNGYGNMYGNGGGNRAQPNANALNEEKFSSVQAPFLVQPKLSTNRRQKMLKGLKK